MNRNLCGGAGPRDKLGTGLSVTAAGTGCAYRVGWRHRSVRAADGGNFRARKNGAADAREQVRHIVHSRDPLVRTPLQDARDPSMIGLVGRHIVLPRLVLPNQL